MSADKVDAREAWIEQALEIATEFSDRSFRTYAEKILIEHLRTTPEGYVLVPVKLTEPLLVAGRDSVTLEHGVDAMLQYAWSQIIDAAQEGK